MSGGTSETHYDTDPLLECTHKGANGAGSLNNDSYTFPVFVKSGLAAENSTQNTSGTITAVTENSVTVTGVTWNNGDTLKVFKTANRGSRISSRWVDVSRGWKSDQRDLVNGWRDEDVDEPGDRPEDVFSGIYVKVT